MEEWQKNYITKKLVTLSKEINCDVTLLNQLESQLVLTRDEIEQINEKVTQQDKTNHLLTLLYTKTGGYFRLLEAVSNCAQTGARGILLKGLNKCGHSNQLVNLHGVKYKMKDIFKTSKKFSLSQLLEVAPDMSDYLDYYGSKTPHILFKEPILSVEPYYITRSICSKRSVNIDIFKNESSIFLFKGFERPELHRIAGNNKTLYSSDFENAQTDRFVMLENEDDILGIVNSVQVPVHFIEQDSEKNNILQGTWGGIQNIRANIKDDILTYSADSLVPKLSLTDSILIFCDIPGIGKSQLASKLAQELSKSESKTILLYLNFPTHAREVKKLLSDVQDNCKFLEKILECLASNYFCYKILARLVYTEKWKVCLVLDGYDHMLFENHDLGIKFLKVVKSIKEINYMIVTARPNVKHELENILGKLTYKISRLSEDCQIDLLCKYLETNNMVAPSEVDAKEFFRTFNVHKTLATDNIGSIPLHCVLMAKMYVKNSVKFQKRPKIHVSDEKAKRYLFDIFDGHIKESYDKAGKGELEEVKRVFTWAALSVKFDDIASKYATIYEVSNYIKFFQHNSLATYRVKDDIISFTFTHDIYAEFIIADFVASTLLDDCTNNNTKIFLDFIFNTVLSPHEHSILKNPIIFPALTFESFVVYEFTHKVICCFLDTKLHVTTSFQRQLSNEVFAVLSEKILNAENFYKLLLCCAFDGCYNIMTLVKKVLLYYLENTENSTQISKLEELSSGIGLQKMCTNLLLVASSFSNAETVAVIYDIFEQCFKLEIKAAIGQMERKMLTPLHIGIYRGHYGIVARQIGTFVDTSTSRGFVHTCVFQTKNENLNEKEDILNLLVLEFNNILHEKCEDILPVSVYKIHLNLLKILIRKNADLYTKNHNGDTFLSSCLYYMSPEEYHDLVKVLLEFRNEEAIKLLSTANSGGKRPIHEALELETFQIKKETLNLILEETKISVDDVDESGNTLLLLAITGRNRPDLIQELVNLGASIHFKSSDGNNLVDTVYLSRHTEIVMNFILKAGSMQNVTKNTMLHIAALLLTPNHFHDSVMLVIDNGMVSLLRATNENLDTPLQLAIQQIDVKLETIESIYQVDNSLLQSKNSSSNTLLHTAVYYKRCISLVRKLVSLGVEYTHVNNSFQNLLHIAAEQELSEHFRYFLELGVSKDKKDINGNTPGDIGKKRLIKYLGDFPQIDKSKVSKILEFIVS